MRAAQASEARIIAWFCCSASTFHGGIRPLTMQAQNQSDCFATDRSNRDATKAPTVVLPDPGGPESTRRKSSLTGQTYSPAKTRRADSETETFIECRGPRLHERDNHER